MITLVTILHVLVSVFLILVILLQAGKGGGMGAAFGGAGAQTVFGGRGAQTLLGKVTSVSAGIFMITSVTLAYNASRSHSVVQREASAPAQQQPAAPGQSPLSPPPNAPESTPPAPQGK
ncbi:preprotein translocase subunit SecG [Anaeromyxobacter terrae]|uniref:preprotein translocase subunit SecG n=1 Tax=Anaeromyxobacter terrae TaxID=2925406 RepID=UPI001F584F4D|nr:preprotein translocase subunit SecG [Anaeromyxobacter sp. SG22]